MRRRVGLPEDWTHHPIKFRSAALRQHPEIASRDPRAAFQRYREARAAYARKHSWRQGASAAVPVAHRDWSEALGNGRIQFGQYPAQGTSDPCAPLTSANCTTDFVVFGLNAVGSAIQANLIASNNLYSGPNPALCPELQHRFLLPGHHEESLGSDGGDQRLRPVAEDHRKCDHLHTSAPVCGRTSGIIPDNNSIQGQASSIYFSNEAAPIIAVKLTQQGLN